MERERSKWKREGESWKLLKEAQQAHLSKNKLTHFFERKEAVINMFITAPVVVVVVTAHWER